MKQYIYLLQEFLSLGGFDTTHLRHNDTDLVTLQENDELVVVFNNNGSEDLFIIFDDQGATITFGQWADLIQGQTLQDFEYLCDLIISIIKGNYYVREAIFDEVEIALLICDETDQVINSYIARGAEILQEQSAFDFISGLDFSEVHFNEVRWLEDDVEDEDIYWLEEDEENGDWADEGDFEMAADADFDDAEDAFFSSHDEEDDDDDEELCPHCGMHHH